MPMIMLFDNCVVKPKYVQSDGSVIIEAWLGLMLTPQETCFSRKGLPSVSLSKLSGFSASLSLGAVGQCQRPSARRSERVLGHIYPQSNHRAASEVDDGVDRDHFPSPVVCPGAL